MLVGHGCERVGGKDEDNGVALEHIAGLGDSGVHHEEGADGDEGDEESGVEERWITAQGTHCTEEGGSDEK